MKTFGLLGFPLTHSFSKAYFQEKWAKAHITDCSYELFSFENILDFWQNIGNYPDLKGFNVTIPHKQTIIKYLDAVHPTALAVGAVNTVKRTANGWEGYNTDIIGFQQSIQPLIQPHHQRALVLGTGGASRAVCFVLKELKIDYQLVSRYKTKDTILYTQVDIADFQIIINTTPIGMSPKTDDFPALNYAAMNENHLVYDLVYNPAKTIFLQKSQANNALTKNGLEMLYLQADSAWAIWSQD